MFETVSGWVIEFVATLQQWLFEGFVQPLLFAVGLMRWQEDAFDATEWFVIGVLEVALLALLLGSAQRLWPAEPLTDRRAVRTDILYTLLHRLGAVPVAIFFLITPVFDALEATLRLAGFSRLNLETLLPWLDGRPLMAFLAYLVVLDAADYLIHRAQHTWRW